MRTAEEILDSYYPTRPEYEEILSLEDYKKREREISILAINEARKEAIEECAERAVVKHDTDSPKYGTIAIGGVIIRVNKDSILSLIDELK